MAEYLRDHNVECEFADPNYLVLMFTPAITDEDVARLTDVLLNLPRRPSLSLSPPSMIRPARVMTIREALFSPAVTLPATDCVGRVLAVTTVGCPPAVPIVACGEVIDENALLCFAYYGIDTCSVIRKN